MNLIRTRQPISRADLARHTGLQRSTISLITEQLISEQWITEGALGHLPRGRKPRFLNLNNDRAGIIGVNIRPQTTTLALTDLNARFITQDSLKTFTDPYVFLDNLTEKIQSLRNSHPLLFVEGIGVGVPGRVDRKTQRLTFAPNLNWRDIDFKGHLEKSTGLPVEVDNTANSCALFEMWFGNQSEGVHDLIAVTVSEGVGTGIIVNDQLICGPTGMAGEFGHVSLSEDGPDCSCGNRGCWEVFASNNAAVNYYAKASINSRNGNKQSKKSVPTFEDLLRLYEQGDPKAIEAIERMAHYLGVGISMLITGFAPSLIAMVGEVTRIWDKIGPIVEQVVKEKSPQAAPTRITPLDELAYPRLRGPIALVLQKHFVAPSVA